MHPQTVLLALSGGVDSAVAALLLKERGFHVVGAFLKLWSPQQGEQGGCYWRDERRDAYAVGARLGIPVITLDFEREYREEVMETFYRSYAAGETPNPDLLCNSKIKFPLLRKEAERRGFDHVATGHYARVSRDEEGITHLLVSEDQEKDQTYFLARLGEADLKQTLFPIGEYTKTAVREMAARAGIQVWNKRSTRGICFIGKVDLPLFLEQRIANVPGDIRTADGELLGHHAGLHHFTIGQRHGFGLGGGNPYYVSEKLLETKTLVVTKTAQPLYSMQALLRNLHWIGGEPATSLPLFARIRYRAPLVSVVRSGQTVIFAEPQRAVTPGQELVFYSGEVCLGSGTIVRAE